MLSSVPDEEFLGASVNQRVSGREGILGVSFFSSCGCSSRRGVTPWFSETLLVVGFLLSFSRRPSLFYVAGRTRLVKVLRTRAVMYRQCQ